MAWINILPGLYKTDGIASSTSVKRGEYIAGFLVPVFSLGFFVMNNVNNATENILLNFAGDAKLQGQNSILK